MPVMVEGVTGQRRMSLHEFRGFQAVRPDDERWELVDGVPVMMTPARLGHARIAGNVERLLSDSLEAFDPTRIALQQIGVDLGLTAEMLAGLGRTAGYAPQPDVGVIDALFDADQRFARKLYVAVEISSSTDDDWLPSVEMRWIDAKTRIYQAHPHCEAVIVVEQHQMEARLVQRSGSIWRTTVLTEAADELTLPTCGVICRLADLYRGTPLASGPDSP